MYANENMASRAQAARADNREIARAMQTMPSSFSGTLKGLMTWKGMTVERLAEASLISPKTIQRLRNDEEYETTLETVVSLCIGLKIQPAASEDLLRKARFTLKFTELHLMYRLLLTDYFSHSICECNELLTACGFPPLGKVD